MLAIAALSMAQTSSAFRYKAATEDPKNAGKLKSMKGWDLYVWEEKGDTLCSLLAGTNAEKSDDQIAKAAIKGVEAIKTELDKIEPGQHVLIMGQKRGDHPPQKAADELANYCTKIGLDAHGH